MTAQRSVSLTAALHAAAAAALHIAAAASLILLAPTADAQEVFDLHTLAPGILAAVVVRDPPAYAFANSLVVMGGDGVLVVDTQQSPAAARSLIAAIRRLTSAPVKWVVNTHWHGDHVNGNQAYAQAYPGVEFIAHESITHDMRTLGRRQREAELAGMPAAIAAQRSQLSSGVGSDGVALTAARRNAIERSLTRREAYSAELESVEPSEPTLTVSERLDITVGSHHVVLVHVGPAHTRGDLVVFLPQHGIAAVGDLLEHGVPWFDDADPAGWLAAVDRIAMLEPGLILPSHGAPVRDARLIDDTRALLREIVAQSHTDSVIEHDWETLQRQWHERYGVSAAAFQAGIRRAVARARLTSGTR